MLRVAMRPENGVTEKQPFPTGTGGSQFFRIPGIVSLDNGNLVASCDARWDHDGDGAGLDTIVSVTNDNGLTWHYTFANYFGDNGNCFNDLSTSFIDPAIATDGSTVYLLADLFPAAVALNTSRYKPVPGQNGIDENGNLKLRRCSEDIKRITDEGYEIAAAQAKYEYYLNQSNRKIYSYGNQKELEGYTVDEWFHIKGKDGTDTNLFFEDSPFQPYPTDYLYFTSSQDGIHWSKPKLLNLKREEEQTLLAGPGNGTYDRENKRLIFTAYEYTNGYQRCCLIWMDEQGRWHRTSNATQEYWSSEATAVLLRDGTVRCFYRDQRTTVHYTDYTWDEERLNYIPGEEIDSGAKKTYGNQLSAIFYSRTINGRDIILLSTACSEGRTRANGVIYVFTVMDDKTMRLLNCYSVNKGMYAYSCLCEMKNGDIALLYEYEDAAITFQIISINDILND